MKYIIIDDNTKFANSLLEGLKEEGEVIIPEGKELIELARDIQEKAKDLSDTVLLININLNTKNYNRQEQKGIELLIWLRINDVLNHVVLYSFETLHSLLNRNPKHLIATSQGTTFVQLPDAFEELQMILSKKKEDKKKFLADADNVRETLKPAFSIEKFRHREANWWGVKQLWDVHKIISNNPEAEYPTFIEVKLQILNNSIARFIYEFSVETIQKAIADGVAIRKKKYSELERKIKDLTGVMLSLIQKVEGNSIEIDKKEKEIEQLSETYLKCNDINISQQIRQLKADLLFFNEVAALENAEKNMVAFERDKDLLAIKNLNHQLENVREILKDKYNDLLNLGNYWISQISKKNVFILYIDDNAENGWDFVFRNVFPNTTIDCVIPENQYKENIELLYVSQIQPVIEIKKPNIILLDLRLFDEDNDSIEVDKLSGTYILQRIKESHPEIPVIITTASNKLWSFRKLSSLGADGYWVKEGLDERRDAQNSVKNYFSLVRLVTKASSDKYLTLKKLIEYDLMLAATQSPWWSVGTWSNTEIKNGNTTEIRNIIDSSIKMLSLYLHEFHMEETTKTDHEEKFFISSLIMRLCSVYEFVHNIDRNTFQTLTSSRRGGVSKYIEDDRGDKLFLKLKKLRNKAAHTEFWSLNWDSLEIAVNETVNYLKPS